MNFQKIVENQRRFFNSSKTRDVTFRIAQLNKLYDIIKENESTISEALQKDLRKSEYESYASEIGIVLDEIRYVRKHIKKWSKPKRVKTPIFSFPGKSTIYQEPYGVALVISPWNYPFQLTFAPLIGAIAAGNTAILKPSEYSCRTSEVIAQIVNSNFDEDYLVCINGDVTVNQELLKNKFDYIFFTGSTNVGRIIMTKAASDLTPVTLELGGKSPVIIDKNTDIEKTARRIVWGKTLNSGQTCIAPDYAFIHRSIYPDILAQMKKEILRFFGNNIQKSSDYARIVNKKNFERLVGYLDGQKIFFGGDYDIDELFIAPTILENTSDDAEIMKEEIFGPILPTIPFESIQEPITYIQDHDSPLALYLFSKDRRVQKKVINNLIFGGASINDTILHIVSPHLPFGGIGNSGIGNYHGKASFDTFSHQKSVLKKSFWFDPLFRYPPYDDVKLRIIKKLLK